MTDDKKKEGWRIVDARFLAAARPGGELPAPITVEIAFAGRSNVGKSSLINALVERHNLVRTSSTPGATRQLNLFEARARDGAVLHLVDLPGFGFTRRSRSETASWKQLVESYLTGRPTLVAVVLLVDVRRGLEDDDRELCQFVSTLGGRPRPGGRTGVDLILVATKLDKLSRAAQRPALAKLGKTAGVRAKVIGFSSVTGDGRAELWGAIRRAADVGSPEADSRAPAHAPAAEIHGRSGSGKSDLPD